MTGFTWHLGTRQAVESGRQSRAQIRFGKNSQKVRNSRVIFRICDAYVPEPVQILMELHGKDQLQGEVIDVSDAGSQEEAFAVVEVKGLSQAVVVPIKQIRRIPSE